MNKLFDLIFSGKEGTSSKHKHKFRIKNSTTFCVACKANVKNQKIVSRAHFFTRVRSRKTC